MRNRWAALPHGARIGIIAGALGAFAIAVLAISKQHPRIDIFKADELTRALVFCCIKQRRTGRKEHQALLAVEQKEAAELQEYKIQMQSGKFGFGNNRG